MTKRVKRDLTVGSIGRHLVVLTLPMVGAILSLSLFNLADTYFVSLLGNDELAALSFTFPVTMVLFNVTIGIGIGVSSVIARSLGEGEEERVKEVFSHSVLLALLLVLLVAVAGIVTLRPLFLMLGTDPQLIPHIESFMIPWYVGVLFLVLPMICNSALRALGNTLVPSAIMVVTAVVNFCLDPILIFGWGDIPGFGVAGAAYASVIARACGGCISLYYVLFKEQLLLFDRFQGHKILASWQQVLRVSFPAVLTNMIVPVTAGVVTFLLSRFGKEAVAGFGVASRVETFALIGFLALSATIGPVVGQNWGAKRFERVREALTLVSRISIVGGVFITLLLVLLSDVIATGFSDSLATQRVVVQYLTLLPFTYGALGIIYCTNAAFNALGKAPRATVISVVRMVVLYLPAALLGRYYLGIDGIFLGACVGNLGAAFLAIFWQRRYASP